MVGHSIEILLKRNVTDIVTYLPILLWQVRDHVGDTASS
jgi:hypothetical protein